MNKACPAGICKFKNCDSPSVLNGYCKFHYDILHRQQNQELMERILCQLSELNNRLLIVENITGIYHPRPYHHLHHHTSPYHHHHHSHHPHHHPHHPHHECECHSNQNEYDTTSCVVPTKHHIIKKTIKEENCFIPNINQISTAVIVDIKSAQCHKNTQEIIEHLNIST